MSELWHRKHLKTVSSKLRHREHQRFLAVCAAAGLTPYAAIKGFCKSVTVDGLKNFR